MKLQFWDGTGSYVRGIEAVEFLGTEVRILRNPLEPGLSSDLTSYPTKPAGIPKQYRLLKYCIQGANLFQPL